LIRLRLFAAIFVAAIPLFVASPSHAEDSETTLVSEVTIIVTPGGDDMSYQIPLLAPVIFCGVEYDVIFATTNAVITFGQPDGTYWDYPQTPSISLGSQDWVAYPNRGDEFFIISYTDSAFQIDMSVRPYGSGTNVEPSRLLLSGTINPDRTITFSYYLENVDMYGDRLRYGVRAPTGEILTLQEAGFYEITAPPEEGGGIIAPPTPDPVEPSPTPTDPQTPNPEPTPTQTPPTPEETLAPVPVEPGPSPEPIVTPEPTPEPVKPEPQQPEEVKPTPEPEPTSTPTEPETPTEPSTPEPPAIEPEQELSKEELMAQLTRAAKDDDPSLPEELAAIPFIGDIAGAILDLFNNLGNVGADMTPEVRETAQKIAVVSIIVTQIVGVSTFAALASTSRK
jgi:hypothetical protein